MLIKSRLGFLVSFPQLNLTKVSKNLVLIAVFLQAGALYSIPIEMSPFRPKFSITTPAFDDHNSGKKDKVDYQIDLARRLNGFLLNTIGSDYFTVKVPDLYIPRSSKLQDDSPLWDVQFLLKIEDVLVKPLNELGEYRVVLHMELVEQISPYIQLVYYKVDIDELLSIKESNIDEAKWKNTPEYYAYTISDKLYRRMLPLVADAVRNLTSYVENSRENYRELMLLVYDKYSENIMNTNTLNRITGINNNPRIIIKKIKINSMNDLDNINEERKAKKLPWISFVYDKERKESKDSTDISFKRGKKLPDLIYIKILNPTDKKKINLGELKQYTALIEQKDNKVSKDIFEHFFGASSACPQCRNYYVKYENIGSDSIKQYLQQHATDSSTYFFAPHYVDLTTSKVDTNKLDDPEHMVFYTSRYLGYDKHSGKDEYYSKNIVNDFEGYYKAIRELAIINNLSDKDSVMSLFDVKISKDVLDVEKTIFDVVKAKYPSLRNNWRADLGYVITIGD